MKKRVILVVAECLGIGETADSAAFGDQNANTLQSIYSTGKLNVPFLRSLGLFNLEDLQLGRRSCIVSGAFGKCSPASAGKGTLDGYLELAGRISKEEVTGPLPLGERNAIDIIRDAGLEVFGIGRASDVFKCEAVGDTNSVSNIRECINASVPVIRSSFEGLCILSLPMPEFIDPITRKLPEVSRSITYLDKRFSKIVNLLYPTDILIITGLHGIKPGYGYTRESVPVLIIGEPVRRACALHPINTLADISATILDYFGLENTLDGESFLSFIERR